MAKLSKAAQKRWAELSKPTGMTVTSKDGTVTDLETGKVIKQADKKPTK
jgi:hypothetical protein